MRMQTFVVSLTLIMLAVAGRAAGQDRGEGRVSLTALGGASAGSGDVRAAVGATLLFDVSRRVGIEARSVYMDRGPGSSAFDLTANILMNLLDSARANPYVSLGGGAYITMFDLGNRRLAHAQFR